MKRRAVLFALVALCAACQRRPQEPASQARRIVTIGGTITEIVFALGAGDQVVGVDTTSLHPARETGALPKIGFFRRVGAEGVLALDPTLVLATSDAGPPEALEQIEAAGVQVVRLPSDSTVAAARQRILTLGGLLGAAPRARELVFALDDELDEARKVVEAGQARPRVLFVYARGANILQVGGRNTPADAMITLAGGTNAADFDGFRPMSAESVVAANPDVLLMLDGGAASLGGHSAIWALPGVELTPAGQSRRLILMDDLELLGFGPRIGHAAWKLARTLHEG